MNMINRQGWLWVDANQFFGHPHISHRDLIEGDYYYDNIRQGYLIKPQSKTYTILVLKEVDFAIKEYTREQCKEAIIQLEKKYNLDKPIVKYTNEIDAVVNDLAELEQRLDYLQMLENIHKANAARWGNTEEID